MWKLGGLRQREIVRSVGDQLVAEGFADFAILHEECPGHSFSITRGQAHAIPAQPGTHHAKDAFRVEILAQLRPDQAERLIQLSLGVRDARKVHQLIRREKFLSFFFRAEVHKGQPRTLGFDGFSLFSELGDRLAAKCSAEVAQEDQQQRTAGEKRGERLPVLRGKGVQ